MKLHKGILSKKQIDLFLLVVFPIIATIVLLVFKVNFLASILLFLGIPSAYLALRRKDLIIKTGKFAFIFSIPATLIIDYLAVTNRTWLITQSVFNIKLLDTVIIEQFLWAFLYVFFIVIFYEHFLDHGRQGDKLSTNIKNLIFLLITMTALFLLTVYLKPSLLRIEYFYLKAGIIAWTIPMITFLAFFPCHLNKFVKLGTYFFAFSLLYELSALHSDLWSFPGHEFIGFIKILDFHIPIEECLFWFVISTSSLLSYYEFFADDRK